MSAAAKRDDVCCSPGSFNPPDLAVDITITVVGIETKLRAAIVGDIIRSHQMHRDNMPVKGAVAKKAVQFIYKLPALQVKRFGNRCGLEETGLDSQEGGRAAVTGGK